MSEHEYAFDVKLYAVVRIRAHSKKDAVAILDELLDTANLNTKLKDRNKELLVTEASLDIDDVEYPYLFEIDGEDPNELEE